jgi:hypothetical protein
MDIITLLNSSNNNNNGFVVSFDKEMHNTVPLKKELIKYIVWHHECNLLCYSITDIHKKTKLSWSSINKCLKTGNPVNGFYISYYK